MTEVLASQRIMLQRRGKEMSDDDQEMGQIFTRHLDDITAWLDTQPHLDVIYVNYSDVMAQPLASAETIRRFLGNRLDAHKMASVVDPSLYRNRAPRH